MLRALRQSLPSPAATLARRPGVLVTVIAATCLLLVVGCGDDDDSNPTGPGEDTTAPRIASVTPIADATAVAPNADVVVVFDEDMDPASATGHVVLSSGDVTGTTWDDARTLRIEHTPWDPGVRVEVTLTTGLADAAGNGLAVDHTFGFWTVTDDVLLLLATPRNGADDVPTNTTVTLLFNRTMDLDALTAATTVDDGTDPKAPAAFACRRGSDTSVVMEFEQDLPPSSTIMIVITTDATSITGEPLTQETVFGFTTGDAADVTPPELFSVEPANGTSVDPATSTIVFTFSEPIDVTRFEPSTIGGQLLLMLESIDAEPLWSDDDRRLTVSLPTPLPDGVPIAVRFDTFFDRNGVEATGAIDYRIDVRGTADPWPVVDGRTQTWRGFETVTEGDGSPRFEGYGFTRSFEERVVGSVYVRDFHDDPPAEADEWDVFERDGNAVWYLGYGELDEGTPVEVRFADRVTWLPLPPIPAAGWSGDTTMPFGDVTASLHYSGAVVSREDLSLEPITTVDGGPIGPVVVWVDCWKVSLQYVIRDGPTSLLEGDATLWYAPAVGLVREATDEQDHVEDRVATYDEWLFTSTDDGGSGAKARR